MELAVDLECGKIVGHIELLSCIGAVQNEVKSEGIWLGPVLFGGINEMVGSQSFGIFFFIGCVRKSVDLSSECGSPENCKVAQTSTNPGKQIVLIKDTKTYIPAMAIFFPGPVPARLRGLKVVIPAHIIGAARVSGILSGIGKAKYSWTLI